VSNANKDTIWKVGIDGGQPLQLTEKLSFSPAISPDGKEIVCSYLEDQNSPAKLAILPSEGGQPIKTFPLAGQAGTNLSWNANGSAVVLRCHERRRFEPLGATRQWRGAETVDRLFF